MPLPGSRRAQRDVYKRQIRRDLRIKQIIVSLFFQKRRQVFRCDPMTAYSLQVNILLITRLINKFQTKFIVIRFDLFQISLFFLPMLECRRDQIDFIPCVCKKFTNIAESCVCLLYTSNAERRYHQQFSLCRKLRYHK